MRADIVIVGGGPAGLAAAIAAAKENSQRAVRALWQEQRPAATAGILPSCGCLLLRETKSLRAECQAPWEAG